MPIFSPRLIDFWFEANSKDEFSEYWLNRFSQMAFGNSRKKLITGTRCTELLEWELKTEKVLKNHSKYVKNR